MSLLRLFVIALSLLAAAPAVAVQPDEMLANPTLEARARALSQELRCMVCQNESIDDSNAPLAHDLRVLVRQRIKAGDTDQQVLNFLVARYGEFILLKPPFNWSTALLWLLSPLVLIGAGFGLVRTLRRQRQSVAGDVPTMQPAPLSEAEELRLQALLRPRDAAQSVGEPSTNG
jgi:cytochrome c-type biogenesis protein CcmH